MGHYDNCRDGYCAVCGAAPGNIKNGKCEFCYPKLKRITQVAYETLSKTLPDKEEPKKTLEERMADLEKLIEEWTKKQESKKKEK